MVAAAVIGSAVVGAAASSSASSKASKAAGKATDAQSAAASETAQLGRDRLAFEQQQYADGAVFRDRASDIALDTAEQQLGSARTNEALAAEYADYNRNTFRPLEQSIVADAAGYDTPEKRQAAAEASMADVNSGFAATGEARARQLAASGIDPGSTRAMSVMNGQDVDQATTLAGAAYKARQGVEQLGRGMKMDAASLGRNLPSNQATSAQLALNAGNSAVNNGQVPVNIQQQSGAGVGAGYSAAMQGANNAGNIYGNIAQQNSGNDSALWGALGSVAGQWAGSSAGSSTISGWMGTSDENVKKDIEPASDEEALEEVTGTPVSNWQYDPAQMAAHGIEMAPGDEGQQTGPMAQDVQETMGEEAAPGGKKINLVTMNGKLMASVQALDKKVNKLASMIGSGNLQAEARA